MNEAPAPLPINIAVADHYTWGGVCDGWHLVRRPDLGVIRERMPPGTAEARHLHTAARQFFYVLAGEAVLEVAGRDVTLGPGDGAEVPPGVPHQMFNRSGADVEFLVVSHPHSHGDRTLCPPPGQTP